MEHRDESLVDDEGLAGAAGAEPRVPDEGRDEPVTPNRGEGLSEDAEPVRERDRDQPDPRG